MANTAPKAHERSEGGVAWPHLDGGTASAVEHHEPVTVAGAKHTRVLCKCLGYSLDDLVLVGRIVLIPNVELVTAHESDPRHYFCHAQAA
jgi:hypothetical protein